MMDVREIFMARTNEGLDIKQTEQFADYRLKSNTPQQSCGVLNPRGIRQYT